MNCPRCDYDLRGAPGPDIRCPECGLQLPPNHRVIAGRGRRSLNAAALLFLLSLWILSRLIHSLQRQGTSGPLLCTLVLALLALCWRTWWVRGRRWAVVIAPPRLYWMSGRTRREFDLTHARRADLSVVGNELELIDVLGNLLFAVPNPGGGSAALASIRDTINELLQAPLPHPV